MEKTFFQACQYSKKVSEFWDDVKNLTETDFKILLSHSGITKALQVQNYQFILDLISFIRNKFNISIETLSTSLEWFGEIIHLIIRFDDVAWEIEPTDESPNMLYLLQKQEYNKIWNFNNYDRHFTTPFLLSIQLNRFPYTKQLWDLNMNQSIDCSTFVEYDTGRNALHVFWCSLPEPEIIDQFLPFLYKTCGLHKWALKKKDILKNRTPLEYQKISNPLYVSHLFDDSKE